MLPRLVSMLCRRSRAQMPLRGAASCVPSRQDVHRAGLGFVIALLLLLLAVRAPFAAAQGLDPATLLRPATDTWPTYNGDYSGARFSTLDQINAGNVGSLALAWVFRAHRAVLKSTPLEVNDILYLSAPGTAKCAGTSSSPTLSSATSRPWRRSSSAITSSPASPETSLTSAVFSNPSIRKPAKSSGPGTPTPIPASPVQRLGPKTATRFFTAAA